MSDLSKFTVLSCSKEIKKYKCEICLIYREFLVYFECSHSCCSSCLDNLYDNAINIENDELFKCSNCYKKIYNIEYK